MLDTFYRIPHPVTERKGDLYPKVSPYCLGATHAVEQSHGGTDRISIRWPK
jgi:hypothetical protein